MKLYTVETKLFKKGINFIKAGKYDDGIYFIRKSAKKGYATAQDFLGCAYYNSEFVRQDLHQAIHWWKLAAEQGLARSQTYLGIAYDDGEAIEKDKEKAVYWWKLAAEQGERGAQCLIGNSYYGGEGIEKDEGMGVFWWNLAAKQGIPDAQTSLGIAYHTGKGIEKDQKQAIYWWKLAAEQKDSRAQLLLAQQYYFGWGVEKSVKQAVNWWKLAAEKGEPIAQTFLGLSYYSGEGIEKDNEKAFYWWNLAAEHGLSYAELHLGNAYNFGIGVQEDQKHAVYWWKLAAKQGVSDAQFNLGISYSLGKGVLKNQEQAVYWWKLAAEKGDPRAQLLLGGAYHTGKGIEEDQEQAIHWWKLSAEQGDLDAIEILKEIKSTQVQIIPFPNSKIDKSIDEKKIHKAIQTLKMYAPEMRPDLKEFYLNNIKHIPGIIDSYQENVFEKSIQTLVNIDENHEIEFKETFSIPTKVGADGQTIKTDFVRYAVLKEITGFLNTNDGTLLIGVADSKNTESKNPEICGIEKDNFNGDEDKYRLTIHDVVKSALGETSASLVEIGFEVNQGKTVCRLDCRKSSEPVYCNYKNFGEKPFVRYGTSTVEPPQKEWLRWVKEKFQKA